MRTRYLVALAIVLVGAVALAAATRTVPVSKIRAAVSSTEPPSPPSALDRANIENDMKQLQLYQAQVQILTYQFEQTKAGLAVKLKALERDGWELNLQTWRYEPKAAPPPGK